MNLEKKKRQTPNIRKKTKINAAKVSTCPWVTASARVSNGKSKKSTNRTAGIEDVKSVGLFMRTFRKSPKYGAHIIDLKIFMFNNEMSHDHPAIYKS